MAYDLDGLLVVGISSRALFALEESDQIFQTRGLDEYREYQRGHEHDVLQPGTGFPLVRGLLKLNEVAGGTVVEVIVVSRNDADTGLRILKSAEAHGLAITRAAFTAGEDPWPYLTPLSCNLFLSTDPQDVQRAIDAGVPAARVLDPPETPAEEASPIRIAFDGDAVLFDDESERVFQQDGMAAFMQRERDLANTPMNPGPFEPFLRALGAVQEKLPDDREHLRISLVTSRNAPAHERVVKTLREWRVSIDESFFLGGAPKQPILATLRPHIYFDDQTVHLEGGVVPSAQVPYRTLDVAPSTAPDGAEPSR